MSKLVPHKITVGDVTPKSPKDTSSKEELILIIKDAQQTIKEMPRNRAFIDAIVKEIVGHPDLIRAIAKEVVSNPDLAVALPGEVTIRLGLDPNDESKEQDRAIRPTNKTGPKSKGSSPSHKELRVQCTGTPGCTETYNPNLSEHCRECHFRLTRIPCQGDGCDEQIKRTDAKGKALTHCMKCNAASKPKCLDCKYPILNARADREYERCYSCHNKHTQLGLKRSDEQQAKPSPRIDGQSRQSPRIEEFERSGLVDGIDQKVSIEEVLAE